ncbi:DUF6397 family protein [Streptomyces sp. NPDC059070]|uniref:DUF6397 family protein n=1 Tax=Streptomyces sp. NPDC059070 TaxID=3346713 RepID=UPI0036CFEEB2
MTTTTAAEVTGKSVSLGRAAQLLELKRGELELAVQLGHVRVVREDVAARPRVAQEHLDRIRSAEGFPDALRERVRVVGTAEASQLLAIPAHRFTRLARGGHFTPVKCYLNRYRAVVWLYLAEELTDIALRHPALLFDRRLPKETLARLEAGDDRRPRNWRGRRAAMLLRRTVDPWERAAGISTTLDEAHLAEVVGDPYERAYLTRLRPDPFRGGPDSPAAQEIVGRLLLAQDPDEVLWYRMDLARTLEIARALRPAPRPEWERPVLVRPAGVRPLAADAAQTPRSAPSARISGSDRIPGPRPVQSEGAKLESTPSGAALPAPAASPTRTALLRPERVERATGPGRLRRGLARIRRPRGAARSASAKR